MHIHLAGIESCIPLESYYLLRDAYKLISFYYIRGKRDRADEIVWNSTKPIILDSGAFSFLGTKENKAKNIDWDKYIKEYIAFIKEYNIDNYIELDIDNIVGYKKVRQIREYLEAETNKKSIPVWHRTRGLEDYKQTVREYGYVAIGGLAAKEIAKEEYPMLTPLINIAHESGCKVHGLGFTNPQELRKYHFDSVDSTNWSYGKYGYYFIFTGNTIKMYRRPDGKRISVYRGIHEHNLKEWLKYAEYAERAL